MLWECRRFEEERREFLSGDVGEDVRLGLRGAMENECSRSKLFQIMKRIARRKKCKSREVEQKIVRWGSGGMISAS